MKVEREIAGTALPFAAGTAAYLYIFSALETHTAALASASAFMAAVLLLLAERAGILMSGSRLLRTEIAASMCICGIYAAAADAALALSRTGEEGLLISMATGFGESMQSVIESIPFKNDTTGHVLTALLTGDRNGISAKVREAFRDSGASHILALSGLHLGMIYGIASFITGILGNTLAAKRLRSLILIAACGFYTMATGAGASISRAFIFIVISEAARLCGRKSSLKNTLMVSLLIHLLLSPSSMKDVGFQLSYAAIAGIAWIYPWLKGFWPGDSHDDAFPTRCIRRIWDSAALSISCQLTTGPLAFAYFGTFPPQFILTNLIAIPLTGTIIPAALLTLTLSAAGWHPQLLLSATEWMVTALCEILSLLSTMS